MIRRIVLLFAPAIACASCALPDRRPEAEFTVKACGSVQDLGSRFGHGMCVKLDGSESRSFIGGGTFLWEYAVHGSAGTASFTPLVAGSSGGDPECGADDGPILCGTFFQDVVRTPEARVTVRVTVTDESGGSRQTSRDLALTNQRPSLSIRATPVRPRSRDLFLSPFLIVAPGIEDPDGDEIELLVTRIDESDHPLAGAPCMQIPQITNGIYQDPAPGIPYAYCFYLALSDDPATPQLENSAIRSAEPAEFRFRVRVRERHAADDGLPEPATNCSPRPGTDELVACETTRLEDTVWLSSGGGALGGRIGRISADWRRRRQPDQISIRDGNGMAQFDRRMWFSGSFADCGASCRGGIVALDAAMEMQTISGLGSVVDVAAAPGGGGLGVYTVANNPSGTPGTATLVPGEPYLLGIPTALLPNPLTPDRNLLTLPAPAQAQLRTISGFFKSGDPVLGDVYEFPVSILPTRNDSMWISSVAYCAHYDPVQDRCTSDTLFAPNYDLRLRLVPAGSGDVDVQSVPDVAAGIAFPLYDSTYTQAFALATTSGQVWFADVTQPLETRVRRLSEDGTTVLSSFRFVGNATAIAYDLPRDTLYVADALSGGVHRIEGPGQHSGLVPTALFETAAPFTQIASMAVDLTGGLWIDDRPDALTRQTVYLPPRGLDPVRLAEFSSFGRGIVLSLRDPYAQSADDDLSRGAWRPDLTDMVRVPLRSPEEIPALTSGPLGSSLVGVDSVDGAAYVIAPTTGPNLFRVEPDGTLSALARLSQIPTCGALTPEVSKRLLGIDEDGVFPAAMWLCLTSGPSQNRIVEIELAHLRTVARGTEPVIDGDLPACAGTPGEGPCWRTIIDSGIPAGTPREMALSLGDVHLWILYGDGCNSSGLYTVFLTGYLQSLGNFPPPYVSGSAPLAGADAPRCGDTGRAVTPLVAPDRITGDDVAGVWVTHEDGRFQRWRVDLNQSPAIAPDPNFVILPPAGYEAMSIATDLVQRDFGEPNTDPNGPLELWQAFVAAASPESTPAYLRIAALAASNGTMVLTTGGSAFIDSRAQAMAVTPFSDSVWLSGEDGKVVRIHALPDGKLQRQYERLPDVFGAIGTTPAGKSISVGGF